MLPFVHYVRLLLTAENEAFCYKKVLCGTVKAYPLGSSFPALMSQHSLQQAAMKGRSHRTCPALLQASPDVLLQIDLNRFSNIQVLKNLQQFHLKPLNGVGLDLDANIQSDAQVTAHL